MLRYEDEIREQIEGNLLRVFFPVLMPLYLLLFVLDLKIYPNRALDFFLIRASLLVWGVLCFVGLKVKVSARWYNFTAWSLALLLSLQGTVMGLLADDFMKAYPLFVLNILAGLFVFLFTVRFLDALILIGLFYFPPALVMFLHEPPEVLFSPRVLFSASLVAVYLTGAKAIDFLSQRSYRQKAHLFFYATTDGLSGLKLRRYFFARFIQELSLFLRQGNSFKISVAMIDIDSFKKINDRYGHETGDQVLKHVADLLKATIRVYDVACRFGGEEFVILFPEAGAWEAEAICERIRKVIEETPFVMPDRTPVPLTISLGYSVLVGEDPEKFQKIQRDSQYKLLLCGHMHRLLCQADQALFEAKKAGKNRVAAGASLALADEIDPSEQEAMRGNLVYFDQDVFQFGTAQTDSPESREITELNFYSVEFFFRRVVESLYRAYRNPEWHEVLAVIRITAKDTARVRDAMSRMFRLSDTLCEIEKNVYGAIFFGLAKAELERVHARISRQLEEKVAAQGCWAQIVAAPLVFHPAKIHRSPGKVVTYEEFSDQANELFGILRRYRFAAGETVRYYSS
ncbi:MAG: GGDEF domain-containing protein [Candidatus Omnitrophota bacterium]